MVYRESQPDELCATCRAPARGGACPGCQTPLCSDHTPRPDTCCDVCESRYLARETDFVKWIAVSMIAAAGVLGFVGAFVTHMARIGVLTGPKAHFAPLLLFAAAAAMALIFVCPPLARAAFRRRFLRSARSPRHRSPS